MKHTRKFLFLILKWIECKKNGVEFPQDFREILATDPSMVIKKKVDYFAAANLAFFRNRDYLDAFLKYSKSCKIVDHAYKCFEMMLHIFLEQSGEPSFEEIDAFRAEFRPLFATEREVKEYELRLRDIQNASMGDLEDRLTIEFLSDPPDPIFKHKIDEEVRMSVSHSYVMKRVELVYMQKDMYYKHGFEKGIYIDVEGLK